MKRSKNTTSNARANYSTFRKPLYQSFLATAAISLTACSGGGNAGGGNPPPAPPPNSPPTFTSSSSVAVQENDFISFTVLAADADNDAITFSISGGADAALFSIDSASGLVTSLAPVDFENPSDVNSDNIYEITVRISDGTASALANTSVTIMDVRGDGIIKFVGAATGDSIGAALSGGGDFDGDAVADLLIGTSKSVPTMPNSESVAYLLFSAAAGVDTDSTINIDTLTASEGVDFFVGGLPQSGSALYPRTKVAAGVAPPTMEYGSNYVLLQHLSRNQSGTTTAFFPEKISDLSSLGALDVGLLDPQPDSLRSVQNNWSGATAGRTRMAAHDASGDFDGDGNTDLVVRTFIIDDEIPGDILLISGSQLLKDTENQDLFNAADYGGGDAVALDIDMGLELQANGIFVQNAGDVTGDGADDIIFSVIKTGELFIDSILIVSGEALFRDADGLVALSDLSFPDVITIKPAINDVNLIYTTGGDFDGDHVTDVVIASSTVSDSQTGRLGGAYVLYSSALLADADGIIELGNLDAGAGAVILKGNAGDGSVQHVFAVGDINDQGADDLLISVQVLGVGSVSTAYLVWGESLEGLGDNALRLDSGFAANGVTIKGQPITETTILNTDAFGEAAARAFDTDGDGITDLAIGAMGVGTTSGSSPAIDSTGAVYVIPSSRIHFAHITNGIIDLGEHF